jgi:hypothetical protein
LIDTHARPRRRRRSFNRRGPASGAKDLAALDDAAKVDAMAAVCMSITCTF